MMIKLKNHNSPAYPLSIAPMLKRTDRHCRYFLRLIHPYILLYTEMVTTGAILWGDRARHLDFNIEEHPVILQLGGSNAKALAECASIGEDWGYDEINLNIGCPSNRVQSGLFGACLMKDPDLVAECVYAMKKKVSIPITIKTRIGVDDRDSYEHLYEFIQKVSTGGCSTFVIHARKAWLKGLSPKENREIPPLKYESVYQLKKDFPALNIIINGGVQTTDEILHHLEQVDGVMVGRVAYQNPYVLTELLERPLSRIEILEKYFSYIEKEYAKGVPINTLLLPIFGLFYRQPGGKQWRRGLSELAAGQVVEEVKLLLITMASACSI